jgi:hypothetical protein
MSGFWLQDIIWQSYSDEHRYYTAKEYFYAADVAMTIFANMYIFHEVIVL